MSPRSSFGLEALESRQLLSASVHHGVLRVAGNGGAMNTIVVDRGRGTADEPGISVTIDSVNARGVSKHFDAFFPDTIGITSVRVAGGRRDDVIHINQADPTAAFPATRVDSGNGDDTILTGSEDDLIVAGKGNDTINAGDGANRVFGQDGNDNIATGVGNDRIHAGRGDDVVHAGAGDDIVRGDRGADMLFGEDGNDTLYGEREADTLDGGAGDDILWGGRDNDTEIGGDGNDQLGGIIGANNLSGGAGSDTFVVVSLDQQANTDYNASAPDNDVLKLVSPKTDDGSHPPAI